MVKIGHAVANELGKATGGKPGDQTGKEVRIQDWYDGNWTNVFRPKTADLAELIASNIEKICNNNCFGYGQDDRTSAYTVASRHDFKLDKVVQNCHLDCSSMIALALIASGITISPNMYTGNERDKIIATGHFEEITDVRALASDKHLKRGDILLKAGHTACVLSNGEYSSHIVGGSRLISYMGNSNSIVDILTYAGINSSYKNRKIIAKANTITGYIGTSKQNLKMVDLAKKGILFIPKEANHE